MELPKNEVVTGEVRLSYVNLLHPRAASEGEKVQYGVQLIIPKSDEKTINAIVAARNVARQNGVTEGKKPFKDFPAEKLNVMNLVTKDGDAPENADKPELKGCIALNAYAQADKPPGVLNEKDVRIVKGSPQETEIYSGMYGMVHIQLYPYNNKKQGVAASVINVKKTRDGEPFGGGKRASAEEVFGGGSPFEGAVAGAGSGSLI